VTVKNSGARSDDEAGHMGETLRFKL
jgi:hypothetical protein